MWHSKKMTKLVSSTFSRTLKTAICAPCNCGNFQFEITHWHQDSHRNLYQSSYVSPQYSSVNQAPLLSSDPLFIAALTYVQWTFKITLRVYNIYLHYTEQVFSRIRKVIGVKLQNRTKIKTDDVHLKPQIFTLK